MLKLRTLNGAVHGFSTADLGSMGLTNAPDPRPILESRRRFAEALGLEPATITVAGAVHGCDVARVDRPADLVPGVDGLVTNRRGIALMATFADCLPLVAYDPEEGALGLAHAGWRGTRAGVAGSLLRALEDHFGSHPADLRVGIGPGICGRCYEVGPEFADRFPHEVLAAGPGDRLLLDLPEANRRQFVEAGVDPNRIEVLDVCTFESDQLFSHRRQADGSRFAALVAIS